MKIRSVGAYPGMCGNQRPLHGLRANRSPTRKNICWLSARKKVTATNPCRTLWPPSSASVAKRAVGHHIRTDTEALTKKKLEFNAKNLNDFDAVLFYTGGNLEMNAGAESRADFRLCMTMARASSVCTVPQSHLPTGRNMAR